MKLENNWEQKSLENLERKVMATIIDDNFPLVNKVHHLRKIPLEHFATEDLRLMIGQNEGLYYLINLANERLKDDLFAEDDFYPGDLLQNVLNVNPQFWKGNKELWVKVNGLIETKTDDLDEYGISTQTFYSFGIS